MAPTGTPPDELVSSGPFVSSRNPMFLGVLVAAFGEGLFFSSAVGIGLTVLTGTPLPVDCRGRHMGPIADTRFRDCALILEGDERVLVLGDLHVGKGATSGIELPVGDGSDMIDRFDVLLSTVEPDEAVIAGDLLHSFRTIPRTVRDTVAGLAGAASEAGVRVVVIPGNHDTMLESVWEGPIEREYRVGDTVVCHGHEPPETGADRYVIGHDHPTITIEGRRRPCYLAGDGVYEGADLVVLPAFNRLLAGVEINRMNASEFMSPLVTDADALAPVVRDEAAEETLTFPPLGEFRHRL